MNKAYCHFCQMFFETVRRHCWQCGKPADILGPVEPKIKANKATNSASPENADEFSANEESAKQPLFERLDYEKQDSFSAEDYSGYENLTEKKSGAFRFLKPGLVCLVILIGVGFLLNYTKSYFAAMPDQRSSEISDAKNNPAQPSAAQNGKPQETWFWSLLRSNPTADEIFEHFEEVTETKNKNLLYKTMILSGTIDFSAENAEAEKCYVQMRAANYAGNGCFSFTPSYSSSDVKPGPWDFNTSFEMSLKSPNKIVISGTMIPKDARIKDVKLSFWTGTDGEKKWRVNKAAIRGDNYSDEQNADTLPSIFSNDTDQLSSTFIKEFYGKTEYVGTEIFAGRKHYAVKCTKKSGQADMLYFDVETGLVNKFLSTNGEVYILSYSNIDGVKVPSRTIFKDGNGLIMMTTTGIKTDVNLDDSIFQRDSYQ